MNVFFSYSHRDRQWAEILADQLRSAGFDVWDPATEILPGDNWAARIGQAMDDADAMVVLVSPDALSSEWFKYEIEFALGSERLAGRLIPVIVRPTADLPWILRKLKPIEAGNEPSAAGESIVHALSRAA